MKAIYLICAFFIMLSGCSKTTPYSGSSQPAATLPVVVSVSVSKIKADSVVFEGYVSSDGGAAITARGVCWDTKHNPSIQDYHAEDSSDNFAIKIAHLAPLTTYYARAFASNTAGTSYGSEIGFTTVQGAPVGQLFGGGIIFYADASGQHGLIVAPTDQSAGAVWYNGSFGITGAQSDIDGITNTQQIIAAQGAGSYAATLCTNYTGGGFTDWYLPAKDELEKLYVVRAVIGNFEDADYWSSTEGVGLPSQIAWSTYFGNDNGAGNGNQGTAVKSELLHVRAIRAF